MPRRAVWPGALLYAGACSLALGGCGERAGDPVVRLESAADGGASGAPSAGSGGSFDPGGGGQGGSDPQDGGAPPIGLCGACTSSRQCGDANDVCLRHDGRNFCGRDCDEGFGCPDGYTCVDLSNSRLEQCVPTEGCRAPALTPPSLIEIREYLLARINAERLDRSRHPLEPMTCLDELAQRSALDYASSDVPLGKFVEECDPVWPDCACNWSAQAEVAIAHIGLDWRDAIERAMGSRNGDDRFIESFLDFDVTYVGIGFYISGDEAWIALSLA